MFYLAFWTTHVYEFWHSRELEESRFSIHAVHQEAGVARGLYV